MKKIELSIWFVCMWIDVGFAKFACNEKNSYFSNWLQDLRHFIGFMDATREAISCDLVYLF